MTQTSRFDNGKLPKPNTPKSPISAVFYHANTFFSFIQLFLWIARVQQKAAQIGKETPRGLLFSASFCEKKRLSILIAIARTAEF